MMRSCRVVPFALGFVLPLALAGGVATAKTTKKAKPAEEKAAAPAPGETPNACGCYKKGNGCVCTSKKGKCACPGECEPVGCEEKRNAEMEKEADDAVKRAQADDKKREEAEAKRVQDEEKKRQAAESGEGQDEKSGDEKSAGQKDDSDGEKDQAKPPSPPRKGSGKK